MTTKLPVLNTFPFPPLAALLKDLSSGNNPVITLLEDGSGNSPYLRTESEPDGRVRISAHFQEDSPDPIPSFTSPNLDTLREVLTFWSQWLDLQGTGLIQEKIRRVRHDLRAPLNIILGFSQSLSQRGDWTPQDQSKMAAIYEAGTTLLQLIDSLSSGSTKPEAPLRSRGTPQCIPTLVPGQEDLVILLVDDQTSNRQILADMLKASGALITQAGSSPQAVRTAGEVKPDLVFMDFYMPEETGIQATEALKRLFPDPEKAPRIIGITAAGREEEKTAFLQAGAVEVLDKPVDQGALARCLIKYSRRNWDLPAGEENNKPGFFPQDSGGVSKAWLDLLESALECGSVSKIKQLSQEILPTAPVLGNYLAEKASQYDLESVRHWMEQWKTKK